ncbi:hypothetical protein SADUNF_Sadunf10G0110100 [Salix dunnii]|uniref:Uncharacterized protein n=1 Tax=Salix dunnii TaxID=1413687 RepID=A0A835MPL9_9ROSI|nr:hypothetical protein SADUNF_Sadunf10G0110100 [Salix dunnii]
MNERGEKFSFISNKAMRYLCNSFQDAFLLGMQTLIIYSTYSLFLSFTKSSLDSFISCEYDLYKLHSSLKQMNT